MRYLLAWAGAWLLYLALAGSVSGSEVSTGAIVGAAGAAWATLLARRSPHRYAGGTAGMAHLAAWGRSLRQIPLQLLRAAAVLARMVFRGGPVGALRPQPFAPGAGESPQAHARRASALLCASLGPARFIVRLAPGEARALVHELCASGEGACGEAAADEALLARSREERWLT